jgi:hypothetical protein
MQNSSPPWAVFELTRAGLSEAGEMSTRCDEYEENPHSLQKAGKLTSGTQTFAQRRPRKLTQPGLTASPEKNRPVTPRRDETRPTLS